MKKRLVVLLIAFAILFAGMPGFSGASAAEEALTVEGLDWSTLTDNNINTIGATTVGTMPTMGNPRVLVFYVTFQGGEQNWDLDAEGARQMFFGETGDSLRTYYERSSYGKVHIEGDLIEHTSQKHTSEYSGLTEILDEVLDCYQDKINWSDYDSNGDGYVDGLYLVARTRHSWGGPNFVSTYFRDLGEVGIASVCFMDSQDLNTLCHETCHMFGPPDMYSGVGLNPAGTMTDTIMEQSGPGGDLPGITKFVLGWIDDPLFVSGTGTAEITLESASTHGNIAIIYPNGDPTNPNWMVVEFLTPEANNYYHGVRIWKTNMYLDESYNVIGAGETMYGGISSPYEYLEAMYPVGQTNYYYGPGESVTPYTNPSTCYGVSYKWVGGGKHMDELGFSGLSITVNSMTETTATITVEIDNEISGESTPAVMAPGTENSAYIDDSNRILFATVTAQVPMKTVDDMYLTHPTTGVKLPVETSQNPAGDRLFLYIRTEDSRRLDRDASYGLNLTEAVKSYFGGELAVAGFDGTVTLEEVPMPFAVAGSWSNGGTVYNNMDEPNYFYVDKTHVSWLGYENDVLWLRTNDIVSHTNTGLELEVGEEAQGQYLYKTLLLEDRYYAAVFTIDQWSTNVTYVAVYDREGRFLGDCTPDSCRYEGTNGAALFRNYQTYEMYKLCVNDGVVELQELADSLKRSYSDKWYDLDGGYLAAEETSYYTGWELELKIYDADGTQVFSNRYPEGKCLDVKFRDGELWVLSLEEDLVLYIYDSDFNLVEEKVLLEGHGITIVTDLRFGFAGERMWVELDAVPATNQISYSATFLFLFDADTGTCLQYYRHGDATFRYCVNAVCLDEKTFYIGNSLNYWLLSAADAPAVIYGDANGDGQINVKDVVLLRQHLAGWTVEIVAQNADANGDGQVNVKDVVLLRQYLAGWSVTLGPSE